MRGSGTGPTAGPAAKAHAEKKGNTRRSELLGLLSEAAKELDEEGLEFLLNQANVLVYNMQVERLNERMRKAKGAVRGAGEKGKPGASIPGRAGSGAGDVEIIEKKESGNFFIVVSGYRILFTREEMRSLVKICHAAANGHDASSRLFNWLERNRKDLLIDGGIVSRAHPALESIYRTLISRYKVRDTG